MSIGYTKRQAGSLKYRIDKQMSKIETEVAKLGALVSDHAEGGFFGVQQLEELRELAEGLKEIVERRTRV